ncbi:hypothetical protein MB84_28035 (plasmid) [Pandoraea oxalativorans]|uniref:Helicase C-terminal domain-containing protein n=1 Tax=Pandoraea oxalativorans TaxID=573737 RepID=A0A192B185_9BURK|nr:hypothetical protein MB84_28035 [Pandoraea oxalativorans]
MLHERQIFKEKCPAENQFFSTFRFRISPVAYPLLRRDAMCLCSPRRQIISKARMLKGAVKSLFRLHGRLGRKARAAQLAALDALASDAPRVVLTTGRLVGEGFDHRALDTLVLAMPIAWKGILQQYAGRLHREHAGKTGVRVLDYVDGGHPILLRMWEKRQRGRPRRSTGCEPHRCLPIILYK